MVDNELNIHYSRQTKFWPWPSSWHIFSSVRVVTPVRKWFPQGSGTGFTVRMQLLATRAWLACPCPKLAGSDIYCFPRQEPVRRLTPCFTPVLRNGQDFLKGRNFETPWILSIYLSYCNTVCNKLWSCLLYIDTSMQNFEPYPLLCNDLLCPQRNFIMYMVWLDQNDYVNFYYFLNNILNAVISLIYKFYYL